MTEAYEAFLETLESPKTKGVARSFEKIGECEFTNGSEQEICALILEMRPNSPKRITDICYFLGCFAKYLKDEKLYQTIQAINKKQLWIEAKPNADAKFISYEQFENVYNELCNYENPNWLYFQTLFRSVYEGIYCDDMSVLKNLKASDVEGNTVVLREDNGYKYQLQITKKLAEDLKKLGDVNTWTRRNRYRFFEKQIEGLAPDSCFKVEIRKTNSPTSYRFSYYRILRLVAKEAGYGLLPFQIFISGIMHRIGLALQAQNISISDAFADNNKDRLVSNIIAEELKRCNCQTEVRNFRQIVKGHLEVFELLNDEAKEASDIPFVKPSQKQLDDENLQDIVTYRELDCGEPEKEVFYTGKAQPKRKKIKCEGRTVQPRNRSIAINALVLAKHKCEINSKHSTFIRKSDGLPYTEPHHLVPMAYADNFDVSLDVEENIVSLCSHCHNQLHYGQNITAQIKTLYSQRQEMLKKVGIDVSLEELLSMY